MTRSYVILEFVGYDKIDGYTGSASVVKHGDPVIGRNFAAVVGGNLHKDRSCTWCDGMRKRCQSRRLA